METRTVWSGPQMARRRLPHILAGNAHDVVKGIGHGLPQEAPQAFVNAVLEVAASS